MNIKAMLVSVFRNLIVVCALPLVMVSCMNDARKDAENKYASGVVLIKNTGYYTVKLDDGLALYFSGFSENSITALMVLAGFGMVVGNLVSGRMSDRYTPGRVLMVSQGGICLVCF